MITSILYIVPFVMIITVSTHFYVKVKACKTADKLYIGEDQDTVMI